MGIDAPQLPDRGPATSLDALELSIFEQADAALSACTRRLEQLAPASAPDHIRAELLYLRGEIEAARTVLMSCYLTGAGEIEP